MNTESLDEIIKKYSRDLEQMGNIYGGEATVIPAGTPETPSNAVTNEVSDFEAATESPVVEVLPEMPETQEIQQRETSLEAKEQPVDNKSAVKPPSVSFPEGEASSFADFFARVQSGEGAYPIGGAKVVIYRGDTIYAFVESDENGRTEKIRLPAFPKSNSLESENQNQSIDYNADVFAEGFTAKKGLLVSAVGGSEIVLNVLLVPEGERIG